MATARGCRPGRLGMSRWSSSDGTHARAWGYPGSATGRPVWDATNDPNTRPLSSPDATRKEHTPSQNFLFPYPSFMFPLLGPSLFLFIANHPISRSGQRWALTFVRLLGRSTWEQERCAAQGASSEGRGRLNRVKSSVVDFHGKSTMNR